MKRTPATKQSSSSGAQPIITYPIGYQGQALLESTVMLSASPLFVTSANLEKFKVLLEAFAIELGCANSDQSHAYLQAINEGIPYFWSHKSAPEIAFVSEDGRRNKKRARVLKIMPKGEMLVRYFPESVGNMCYSSSGEPVGKSSLAKKTEVPSSQLLH
jgi:hypothetical protein